MIDYKKIGLKVGVEIHQQLDTNKLFCSCASIIRTDKPDIIIKRKQHAVAGELGEVDVAVAFEAGREREFIYEAYNDTTCLIEIDEEPPHNINEEALCIAIEISLLLNAKILPITQVMRKTVIDGSNTSGFQRTTLIAKDGYIEAEGKKIGIDVICLEEDSARIIAQKGNEIIYRLDRLAIPLVEITTKPEIKSAEEARKVAESIGEILRVCKVKRGLGTIRQDVNLSIEGGARTEIKGVQKLELIPKLIDNEIARQLSLLKEKKRIEKTVRRAEENGSTTFLRPLPGAARMYPETDLPLIKIPKELVEEIKKSLPRLKSELRLELRKEGLHEEMIKLLLQENKVEEYKELLGIYNKPSLIVKMLVLWPKEIARHEKMHEEIIQKKLTVDVMEIIIDSLKNRKIEEADIKKIMLEVVKGKYIEEAVKIKKADYENIEEEIQKMLREKPNLSVNAYIGLLMQKYKSKVDGKTLSELLKKYIQ